MNTGILDDVKSSLVVFLVALPLCLGIALASNAPLASGLIAGILGGIVIGFFSNSHISVSGPAAGLTVIVANGIATLGSFETFTLAVLVAGLFQILFFVLRGGAIGDYFPTAVIKGMLAAIGLILIIKQLPNAFSTVNYGITIISAVSIAIMLFWDHMAVKGIRFFRLIPGALIAVIIAVVINLLYSQFAPGLALSTEHLVQLPGNVFKDVALPNFSLFDGRVFQVGFTIAIVASLETLLCIDAADKIDPYRRSTSKNQELLAQGIGNSISGILGGLPLTAVIVRTSANVAAGAKSKMSAIFHGVWLLSAVMLVPGLLNMIPLAVLACVLLLVGYKLTKPAHFFDMKKRGWDQLFIFCVTIGAIIATDLLIGIGIGLAVAILLELKSPALSSIEVVQDQNMVVVKFVKNVSFLHKAKLLKLLNDIPQGKSVQFHGMKLVRVHIDVHDVLLEYHESGKRKGMEIVFVS